MIILSSNYVAFSSMIPAGYVRVCVCVCRVSLDEYRLVTAGRSQRLDRETCFPSPANTEMMGIIRKHRRYSSAALPATNPTELVKTVYARGSVASRFSVSRDVVSRRSAHMRFSKLCKFDAALIFGNQAKVTAAQDKGLPTNVSFAANNVGA